MAAGCCSIDPRRLGRVRLDPPLEDLGPDAAAVTPAQFRAALGTSTAPVKARLLDQHVVAGIGNLLADEILWQARVDPSRAVRTLERADLDRLQRATHTAIRRAIKGGGVHTLRIVQYRHEGAACPRDGAPMVRSTVGGRTTWKCSLEQSS